MPTMRTFIAIEASQEIRGHASRLIERLQRAEATVKWVTVENMHLTMKFLGDLPEAEVNDVCQAVSGALTGVEPFEMHCHGAGAFPHVRRPRTVWIGTGQGSEHAVRVHAALDDALHDLGFQREKRRFRPHLTIGRVRGGGPTAEQLGDLIAENNNYSAGKVLVDEVVVFASHLAKHGPLYTAMARAPLV